MIKKINMPLDGSTLEDYIKSKKSQYYNLIINFGFHGKFFKWPKNAAWLVIIPASGSMSKFQEYASLERSIDAIRSFKDKWNNHYVNFDAGPWFSKSGVNEIEGISGARYKCVLKRSTPMKYYEDK